MLGQEYEFKLYFSVGTPTPNYQGMNLAITRHLQLLMEHDLREYCIEKRLSESVYRELVSSYYAEFNLHLFTDFVFKTTNDMVTYFKHPVEGHFKRNEAVIYGALCSVDSDALEKWDIITQAYRTCSDEFDVKHRKNLRCHPMRSDVMWAFYGLYSENH